MAQKALRIFWEKGKKLKNIIKKRYGSFEKKSRKLIMSSKSVTALLEKNVTVLLEKK